MSESTCGDRRGTRTGYNRHRRAGEDACADCLVSEREYSRQRYARSPKFRGRRPATHGSPGMYKNGCRCPECRAGQASRMRSYYAKRRVQGIPLTRRGIPRTCEACGVEYQARKDSVRAGRAKYCSARCRNLANLGIDPSAPPSPPRVRKSPGRRAAEKRAAKAAAGSTGGKRVWIQGACAACGEQFCSPGRASRYCSRECRYRATGRRPSGLSAGWIDPAARLQIYRECEWTCQVCKCETLRLYVSGNPLSPTLDHIVPRAKGGTNDRSNLRLLCAACNSLRGDLTFYTDDEVRALRLAA